MASVYAVRAASFWICCCKIVPSWNQALVGRVGTELGNAGVNVISAAVGLRPEDADEADRSVEAVMVVTAESAVPQEVVEAIVASDGFLEGRAVSL